MPDGRTVRRRTLLAGLAGATALGLAGCAGDDDVDGTTDGDGATDTTDDAGDGASDGDGAGDGDDADADPTDYEDVTVALDASTVSVAEVNGWLDDAGNGDVVWIGGDTEIEVTDASSRVEVPAGVTLASDRGLDGSDGGLVYTDEFGGDWEFFDGVGLVNVAGGARVTGLRVRGALDDDADWVPHDYAYEDAGIAAQGPNAEIENCEVVDCAIGVFCDDGTHVHHSHLHGAKMEGLGYGVHIGESDAPRPRIEFNRFEHNRHSVADGGGGGYVVRHNVFRAPLISHVVDQHPPGGTHMEVYNNTVEAVTDDQDGTQLPGFVVRGVPSEGADLHHNWFYNPDAPLDDPGPGDERRAIVQIGDEGNWTHVDEWENVTFSDNHYGETEPPEGVGSRTDGRSERR